MSGNTVVEAMMEIDQNKIDEHVLKMKEQMENKKKIMIAVPNNRHDLPVYFVKSLFGLYTETKKYHDLDIVMFGTTYVSAMRNYLCEMAKKSDCDYIFMVDSDQIYPKDSIIRLLAHNKEIVSGFYQRRKAPFSSVQFKTDCEFTADDMINPEKAHKSHTGLLQCNAMGMGGVLIKVEALTKLKEPYFKEDIINNLAYLGEDIYFSKNCKENNVEMWVDTDLIYPHETQTFISDGKIMMVEE